MSPARKRGRANPSRKARRGVSILSITPFLWFDDQAEAAAKFYTSIFHRSKIRSIVRYGGAGPGPKGRVMLVEFELNGQEFTALNGGDEFPFTPAISLLISCTTQRQVDELWRRLTDGGKPGRCGWLEDRFGVSWQVVPVRLSELLLDPDADRATRVTRALMKMRKIDLAALERAARAS
jgi:predicted 3-demethylubiquinone-9 3-methyltransferase (glyoxalase superfamily)